MTCTARYGEELAPERRLGLQLLRDGQVVAVAWRTIVAVDDARPTSPAPSCPERRDVALLDLDPLLGDAAARPGRLGLPRRRRQRTTFVWTAYAADPAVPVPDLPSTSTLDDDVAAFATETRRSIQFSADPGEDYLGLAGRAGADRPRGPAGRPGRAPRRRRGARAGPARRPCCCSPRS